MTERAAGEIKTGGGGDINKDKAQREVYEGECRGVLKKDKGGGGNQCGGGMGAMEGFVSKALQPLPGLLRETPSEVHSLFCFFVCLPGLLLWSGIVLRRFSLYGSLKLLGVAVCVPGFLTTGGSSGYQELDSSKAAPQNRIHCHTLLPLIRPICL